MKFQTSITKIEGGEEIVRGHKLQDLIKGKSFVETIFLVLKGEFPDEGQKRMLDVMLTAVIDHGPGTASAMNARISASAKNPIHASLAAGLLGLGERHGVAVSAAMEFFDERRTTNDERLVELISSLKEKKVRIAGFGHKVFTDNDPRSVTLFEIAKETEVFGEHCEFALAVQEELNKQSSKKLPLNVDGALGAILCDMGFDAKLGNAIFIIGRVPGLLAQINEEINNDTGIKRLDESKIEYK